MSNEILIAIIEQSGIIAAAVIAVVGFGYQYKLNRKQNIEQDRFGVVRHIYGYMIILDTINDYEEAKRLSVELLNMIAIHYPQYCNKDYINIESVPKNATLETGVKCCRELIKPALRTIIEEEHKKLNTI